MWSVTKGEEAMAFLRQCRNIDDSYEVVQAIGKGGNGLVFRGRHKATGKMFAIKRLDANNWSWITEVKWFYRFSRSPYLIRLKEVVVSSELRYVFLVMDLGECDLFTSLVRRQRAPYSEEEARKIVKRILLGLRYMHRNGVVHRDIKMENVLFAKNSKVKICDFGHSQEVGSPLKHPFATVICAAPEQLQKKETACTAAVDIWAAGVIMAELLLADRLFSGVADDVLNQITELVMRGGLEKLRGELSHVSDDAFDLLRSMLVWDPEKRITADDALLHYWFWAEELSKLDDVHI